MSTPNTIKKLAVAKNSGKLSQYYNNLDELLGVKTVVDSSEKTLGLKLRKDNTLLIDDRFDWYIYDKDPNTPVFTVVGTYHDWKSPADWKVHVPDKVLVYKLGRNDKGPFLTGVQTFETIERILVTGALIGFSFIGLIIKREINDPIFKKKGSKEVK